MKFKGLKSAFGIAGASIGMGIVGEALGSEGLQGGGAVAGKFVAPVVNITMAGNVISMLKDIKDED